MHHSKKSELVASIITVLDSVLRPQGAGVALLIFDYGPGGRMAYGSTASREDMCTAMIEFLDKQEPALLREALERWKRNVVFGAGVEESVVH